MAILIKRAPEGILKKLNRLLKRGRFPNLRRIKTRQVPPETRKKYDDISTAGSFLTNYQSFYSPVVQFGAFDRLARYAEYSEMDMCGMSPETHQAINIYADEITQKNSKGEILEIDTEDNTIKIVVEDLFFGTLIVEHNLWSWVRNLCKYGDFFLLLDVSPIDGVIGAYPVPVNEIEREEGMDPIDPRNVSFRWVTNQNKKLGNSEIIHFRTLGIDAYRPYGTSVLESCRRLWRQLCCRGCTIVWTPTGYKRIDELKTSDVIYCFDKETQKLKETKVKHSFCHGMDYVYEIRTAHKRFYATAEHPVMTSEGIYKKVCELTTNDYVIMPSIEKTEKYIPDLEIDDSLIRAKLNENGKRIAKGIKNRKRTIEKFLGYKINYFKYTRKYNPFFVGLTSLPLKEAKNVISILNIGENCLKKNVIYGKKLFIDTNKIRENFNEFMRFLGFYLGDGWYEKDKHLISFSMGADHELSGRYVKFIESLGIKVGFRYSRKGIESTKQCDIGSKHLFLIFEKLGIKTGSSNKEIPEWIFECSTEDQKAFLFGFIDADGCIVKNSKNEAYAFTINNYKMAEQFYVLAQQTGFFTNSKIPKIAAHMQTFKDRNGDTKQCFCKETYTVKFNVGSHYTKKISENVSTERIFNIEKLNKENVYDIEVEDNNHNFIANGIVVGNCLYEDAALAYRMIRSSERRIFNVEVGNISPESVPTYLQQVRDALKSSLVMNTTDGRADLRWQPMDIISDYFIPSRGGESSVKIDSLPGGERIGDMDDVEYTRNKLFTALGIPKAYLQAGEGEIGSKALLSQLDVKFARTIQRIQHLVESELIKIARIHLYVLGYSYDDIYNFDLKLTPPSVLFEQQKLELWKSKLETAGSAAEGMFDRKFIYKEYFGLSNSEIEKINQGKVEDKLYDLELEKTGAEEEKESEKSAVGAGGGELTTPETTENKGILMQEKTKDELPKLYNYVADTEESDDIFDKKAARELITSPFDNKNRKKVVEADFVRRRKANKHYDKIFSELEKYRTQSTNIINECEKEKNKQKNRLV